MRKGWSTSSGQFVRDVGALASASSIAQALRILVLPALTRLYSPTEFGVFQLFMSLLATLGLLATGGYERAIILPRSRFRALRVAAAAGFSVFATAIIVGVAVALARNQIALLLRAPQLALWLWLLPVGVFAAGLTETARYWRMRQGNFARIAWANISQGVSTVTLQMVLALSEFLKAGGLIIGRILGIGIAGGLLLLGRASPRVVSSRDRIWGTRSILRVVARYKRFPFLLTPALLLSQAAYTAPPFILAIIFSPAVVGYFGIALLLVNAPMQLIGTAFEQTFFQHAAKEFHTFATTTTNVERTFGYLLLIVALPTAALFSFGTYVFTIIFGDQWAMTGLMIVWVTPMMALNFITSPLYPVFNIHDRQDTLLRYQVARIGASLSTLLVTGLATHDVAVTVIAYSLSESAMHVVALVMIFRLSKASPGTALKQLARTIAAIVSGPTRD